MVFSFSWVLAGAVSVVLVYRKCWYWVKMCPSLSANHDANQNSELNKNQKYPKVM